MHQNTQDILKKTNFYLEIINHVNIYLHHKVAGLIPVIKSVKETEGLFCICIQTTKFILT